jgi:hypothetical protein
MHAQRLQTMALADGSRTEANEQRSLQTVHYDMPLPATEDSIFAKQRHKLTHKLTPPHKAVSRES